MWGRSPLNPVEIIGIFITVFYWTKFCFRVELWVRNKLSLRWWREWEREQRRLDDGY